MIVKNNISSSPRLVTELLGRIGIPEESWASMVGGIIKSSKDTARRRLTNQGDFSLDELMMIARHFGTTISMMLRETSRHKNIDSTTEDAHVVIGGVKTPCRVVTRPMNHLAATGLLAYEAANGGLTVCTVADSPLQVPLRPVVLLQIEEQNFPRVRVAVVDDEAPATLVRYLIYAGFDATHYCEAEPVIDLLSSDRRPDAYVLDGTLAKGRTSRRLIEAIRNIDTTVPILLLTGAIGSDPNDETDIGQMMANFSVEVFLKPAPLALIANKLRIMLNPEQAP
jgi:hypothetical protein